MSEDDVSSVFPVNLRKYSDKASVSTSGEYLEIPLPSEIEELGLEKGQDMYMVLSGDKNIEFLRISEKKFDHSGRTHGLSLKYSEDLNPSYSVSLPTEYSIHNDNSPLQNFGSGKTAIVEIDLDSDAINVFNPKDFGKRLTELVEKEMAPEIKAPTTLAGLYTLLETGEVVKEDSSIWASFEDSPVEKDIIDHFEIRDSDGRLLREYYNTNYFMMQVPEGTYRVIIRDDDVENNEFLIESN